MKGFREKSRLEFTRLTESQRWGYGLNLSLRLRKSFRRFNGFRVEELLTLRLKSQPSSA